MTDPRTFAIVGASLAGATAAATLREEGFDGRIVLIGAEPHPPYERPPLSKEYLRGEQALEAAFVRGPAFYEEQGIETRFGVRVVSLDPSGREVHLEDGTALRCERVLIATGARNRRFPIPGIDLPGIHTLRVVEDADAIRKEARPGARAVVVGMGFIGSEVAASLAALGLDVTAVEAGAVPLERVVGARIGRSLADAHREAGVEVLLGDPVATFEGRGRVERVVTRSGRRLACDFAVVGLGVEPATEVAERAGLEVDDGIVADRFCATGVDGVYAAGDVARAFHPVFGRHLRVEHWQNAMRQGASAARNMLGNLEPYEEIPWFWSDQHDLNVQYAGFHADWDELIVRGSIEERAFVAFYLNAGTIDAVLAVNRGRDLRRAIPLIRERARVDGATLRDEAVDLRELAATITSGPG